MTGYCKVSQWLKGYGMKVRDLVGYKSEKLVWCHRGL